MKLKFFLNKNNEKVYTIKESKQTQDAHYKYIKIRDAPKTKKDIGKK